MIYAADEPLRAVLIDGEFINDINVTAVTTLKKFHEQLAQTDIRLHFARVIIQVLDVMKRGSLEQSVPQEHCYPSLQTATVVFLEEH